MTTSTSRTTGIDAHSRDDHECELHHSGIDAHSGEDHEYESHHHGIDANSRDDHEYESHHYGIRNQRGVVEQLLYVHVVLFA